MPGSNNIYRNPEAMWREEDGPKELVLQGLEQDRDVADIGTSIVLMNGTIHSLNILGTEIWKLCDGKMLDEIVSALKDIFDVEQAILEADVNSFLAEMKGLGLVYEK